MDGQNEKPVPVPAVCRMLRTKLAFADRDPTATPWQAGDSCTAVYWCLRTMETAGPDGSEVHARLCREGRCCFEEE